MAYIKTTKKQIQEMVKQVYLQKYLAEKEYKKNKGR